ncbi:MAG: hypothetical protein VX341_06720 [Bdellovibrionota bacterium]|nr:hypothetical protein [Bdellovibrionota bacterium]
MRILDQTPTETIKKAKPQKSETSKEKSFEAKKKAAPERNLSDDEVIAKIKEKQAKKEAVKKAEAIAAKEKSVNEGEEKDHLLESDVGGNDPNDPSVREKLKDILKSGAFKFSQKEKSVLSKIL